MLYTNEIIGHSAKIGHIENLQSVCEFESCQPSQDLKVWKISNMAGRTVALMIYDACTCQEEFPYTFWSIGTGDLLASGKDINRVHKQGIYRMETE